MFWLLYSTFCGVENDSNSNIDNLIWFYIFALCFRAYFRRGGRMIYLSGEHNFGCEKDFERAEKTAKVVDPLVLNPIKALRGKMDSIDCYDDLMSVRLSFIDMCSSVLMLKGWQSSTGANRELGYAMGQGKQIYYEE